MSSGVIIRIYYERKESIFDKRKKVVLKSYNL